MANKGMARASLYDNTGTKVATAHGSISDADGQTNARLLQLAYTASASGAASPATWLAGYSCGADKFGGEGGYVVLEVGGTTSYLASLVQAADGDLAFSCTTIGAGSATISVPVKVADGALVVCTSAAVMDAHGLMQNYVGTQTVKSSASFDFRLTGGGKDK